MGLIRSQNSYEREIMQHRKKDHKVKDCRRRVFLKEGKCQYKERCWWTHPSQLFQRFFPITDIAGSVLRFSQWFHQWESIVFAKKKRQEEEMICSQRWNRCILTESIQKELLPVPSLRPGLFTGKRHSDKWPGNTPQADQLLWSPSIHGYRQFQTPK